MRIAVVSNTAWYLFNFRCNLMQALQRAGHSVLAVAPTDEYAGKLVDLGMEFHSVPISGMGTNPFKEIASVAALRRSFRERHVDLVLSYTPKGNLYSALACIVDGRSFVPNVSGLGRAFIQPGLVTSIVRTLYRFCFRRAKRVFFQNQDDLSLFVKEGLVRKDLAERIPGSGVDLSWFCGSSSQRQDSSGAEASSTSFLMVSRAMWDKGLGEYVEAARAVRAEYPGAVFRLLGSSRAANPAAVPQEVFDAWIQEGVIEYRGTTDDVRPHLQAADCVVLPSYREGMPRVLLEAAAMYRPVITTDAPGCRDAVVDGQTGFMCRVRDAGDLATAMRRFLALTPDARRQMGASGRAFVEEKFDERRVIDRYLALVDEIAAKG